EKRGFGQRRGEGGWEDVERRFPTGSESSIEAQYKQPCERIARTNQVVKCLAGNGRILGLNGRWGGLNGAGRRRTRKKKAKPQLFPAMPSCPAPTYPSFPIRRCRIPRGSPALIISGTSPFSASC